MAERRIERKVTYRAFAAIEPVWEEQTLPKSGLAKAVMVLARRSNQSVPANGDIRLAEMVRDAYGHIRNVSLELTDKYDTEERALALFIVTTARVKGGWVYDDPGEMVEAVGYVNDLCGSRAAEIMQIATDRLAKLVDLMVR